MVAASACMFGKTLDVKVEGDADLEWPRRMRMIVQRWLSEVG